MILKLSFRQRPIAMCAELLESIDVASHFGDDNDVSINLHT
jgi:hypothetical protein